MADSVLSKSAAAALTSRTKAATKLSVRQERLAWLMCLPVVLVVSLVALYPLGQTVATGFTDQRLGSARAVKIVGFDNYSRLLSDDKFWKALVNTVEFTVVSVGAEFILGLMIALVIHSNFKGRGLMRTAMLIPWAIPTAVSSQMWRWMFHDVFGVVNDLLVDKLGLLEVKVGWVTQASTALPAIIAVDVWKTTPFMALLLLAGLQLIPEDLYEAATVDGANAWQRFWGITLPLLRPAILVALIFRTMDALRVFDIIWIMTKGSSGTESIGTFNYRNLIEFQKLGYGSSISVVIFLLIAVFVVLYVTVIRVEET
jgi:trehalose/maltose transport system permease protein